MSTQSKETQRRVMGVVASNLVATDLPQGLFLFEKTSLYLSLLYQTLVCRIVNQKIQSSPEYIPHTFISFLTPWGPLLNKWIQSNPENIPPTFISLPTLLGGPF